jgi:hypothetical protein
MSGHARTFIWNIADDGFLTKFEIRSDDGTLLDGVNTRVVNEIARGATDAPALVAPELGTPLDVATLPLPDGFPRPGE